MFIAGEECATIPNHVFQESLLKENIDKLALRKSDK